MQSISIGALRYDIIADTVSFEKGVFKTRKEMRAAEKVFRSTRTPIEKYTDSLARLREMRKKDAITSEMYRRELKRLKKEFQSQQPVIEKRLTTMQKLGNSMKAGLTSQVKALGAAYVGFTAFDRILGSVQRSMESIDQLQKTADTAGISRQQLQVLQYAAAQTAGLSDQSTLAAIEKMSKRIGEAAKGGGEAKQALDQLGLSAKAIAKLKPDQQFRAIAEAMKGVSSEGLRAAYAQRLFDAEARKLHLTMANGEAGIDAYGKKLEEMGAILSDEQIKAVTDANDAIDSMARAWERVSRTAAVTLAPSLEDVAGAAEDMAAGVNKATGSTNFLGEAISKAPTIWSFWRKWRDIGEQVGVLDPKDEENKAKEQAATDDLADMLERSVTSIVNGVTAERGTREEYRFLVQQQQRRASEQARAAYQSQVINLLQEQTTNTSESVELLRQAQTGAFPAPESAPTQN